MGNLESPNTKPTPHVGSAPHWHPGREGEAKVAGHEAPKAGFPSSQPRRAWQLPRRKGPPHSRQNPAAEGGSPRPSQQAASPCPAPRPWAATWAVQEDEGGGVPARGGHHAPPQRRHARHSPPPPGPQRTHRAGAGPAPGGQGCSHPSSAKKETAALLGFFLLFFTSTYVYFFIFSNSAVSFKMRFP